MPEITEDKILAALKGIQDPDLHVDIVTLGFVRDIRISGSSVSLEIRLTTPACPVKEQMKAEAEAALRAIPGLAAATVTMTADVKQHRGLDTSALKGVRNIIAVGSGKG